MGATFSRVKTWISTEDVIFSDLNAEFDNILTNLTASGVDDFSANVSQMQSTADPGEVGTESLATSIAGEIQRLRQLIAEITGENKWYESPGTSLLSLSNALGGGTTDNRIVSGRVRTTSAQPLFLVPHGAARTITAKGATTNLIYFVAGTQYTISTDVTLTNLTAAPSTNNTTLVNDALATADPLYTKFTGENGSSIVVDAMGSEITALVGKFAAFKLAGASTEYFIAFVESTTKLTRAFRGHFFDSADAVGPRSAYTDNDVITLMKLTWVFGTTAGALTATYNNPIWADDEPTSPAQGDYWFDISANVWKVYGVSSYATANAHLLGICFQDATNTIGARSYEFFKNYDDENTVELIYVSATEVRSRQQGQICSVWGASIHNDRSIHSWDITLDLDSGVTETASTAYYLYLTETGDTIMSDVRPYDRTEDLRGHYHPFHSWRCVGHVFNDASSNITEVESYFRRSPANRMRNIITTTVLDPRNPVILLSGASMTVYLPPAAEHIGEEYTFIHNGTSLSQVYAITTFGAEAMDSYSAGTVSLYTATEALTILADNGNWRITRHRAQTAWTGYTPTFSAGFGTPSSVNVFWRRNGLSLEVYGRFTCGTVAASSGNFTFPASCQAALSTLDAPQVVGPIATTRAGTFSNYLLAKPSDTNFYVGTGASGDLVESNGSTAFINGQLIGFLTVVPIAGWIP